MRALLVILCFSSLAALAAEKPVPPAPKQSPDMSLIDSRVDPCDDYYAYACGKWMQKTTVPADHPSWSRSFTEIEERNLVLLRKMLEGYAKGAKTPENPYAAKLGQFYGSCMNDEKYKGDARKFLTQQLKAIDALERENLPAQLAWMHLRGIPAFFNFSSGQDNKNPQNMIADIDQSGMSLPARDYYVDNNPQMQALRDAYQDYLRQLLGLVGIPKRAARRAAAQILHIETQLAEAALAPVQMRDPNATYHKVTDLKSFTPSLAWDTYFKGLSVPVPNDYNVSAPNYMKRVDAILLAAPMDTIRSYLKLHVIQAAARALPGPIRDTFYGFYFKNLYGMTEIPPHWRRCVDATEEFMPFALGRSYVAMNYKGESKTDTQKLINNIEAQMSALLDRSTWMDAATRKRAHEKLDRMVNQIGYPDHWRSYDDLKVGKSYVENRFNAIAFENTYQFNKIGKPVDRTEWYFGPTTVNAGYDPSNNRMQFPAGILQSPMFSAQFPDVANYAAIGVVMGHELSHGFDDDGSQFDANGVMTDWWTPSVHEEFKRRGECLAKQFDRFPTEGLGHVNGNLTLGEDIGDQGGIKLSYAAWKSTLKGEPSAEDSKKFFLAFAQSWCDKMTPAMEKTMVNTDPHPPARYRVRGGLMNFPEFAKVYQCKEGSEMAPKVRCEVW